MVERGSRIRFADFAEAETCTSTGRLIFGVLALVARYEHELILARTGAGLRAARAARLKAGHGQAVTGAMTATTQAISRGSRKYKQRMLTSVRPMIQQGVPLSQIVAVLNKAGFTTYEVFYGNKGGSGRGGNAMHKVYLDKAIQGIPEFAQLWNAACERRALEALERIATRDSDRQALAARQVRLFRKIHDSREKTCDFLTLSGKLLRFPRKTCGFREKHAILTLFRLNPWVFESAAISQQNHRGAHGRPERRGAHPRVGPPRAGHQAARRGAGGRRRQAPRGRERVQRGRGRGRGRRRRRRLAAEARGSRWVREKQQRRK